MIFLCLLVETLNLLSHISNNSRETLFRALLVSPHEHHKLEHRGQVLRKNSGLSFLCHSLDDSSVSCQSSSSQFAELVDKVEFTWICAGRSGSLIYDFHKRKDTFQSVLRVFPKQEKICGLTISVEVLRPQVLKQKLHNRVRIRQLLLLESNVKIAHDGNCNGADMIVRCVLERHDNNGSNINQSLFKHCLPEH